MRFILPAGTLTSLNFLRDRYQTEKNVNLEHSPSMFGLPTMLGGTDVYNRNIQTNFIKKMMVVFSPNILKEEEIHTPEQWEANLTASRAILAACLYVDNKISSSNSTLHKLIENSLGVTKENYFDKEDKTICYLAANSLINSSLKAREDANFALQQAGLNPFSKEEWRDFSDFVSKANAKEVPYNPYTHYPVSSITRPLFRSTLATVGTTVGYLGGNTISQSTNLMSTKLKITGLVASSLLLVGPSGPMGVALFSQVIAGQLITAFLSISIAQLLGTVMGLVGEGLGAGIGIPLDYAYRLLWSACALIVDYYGSTPNSKVNGIRIADGKTVMGGLVIEVTPTKDLPADATQPTVELKEDGKLYINDQLVTIPETGVKLPQEVIDQLKIQLQSLKKDMEENTKTTGSLPTI